MYRWSYLLGLLLAMPGTIHAATLHVPSEYPTIQEAIDAAAYGDTVEVACGTYYESAEMRSGICLRSATGDPDCVALWRSIHCTDVDDAARIEGFWFHAEDAITCDNSSPAITNCEFYYCAGYWGSINLVDSSPTFSDCVFEHCRAIYDGGAIHATDSHPTLVRCLFHHSMAEDYGGALYLLRGTATFEHCTFWENVAWRGSIVYARSAVVQMSNCSAYMEGQMATIHLTDASQAFLENCIIADSWSGRPVECEGGSEAVLTCCNLHGNNSGDWIGCIADQYGINGNISEDPQFCDPDNGDFTLECTSPCAPFSPPNPECDLIGAWPVGCGGTPVTETTWGAVKALFRE